MPLMPPLGVLKPSTEWVEALFRWVSGASLRPRPRARLAEKGTQGRCDYRSEEEGETRFFAAKGEKHLAEGL
ncbi:MAG: hypothetical protein DMF63_05265 [Acidobacteria bacterium]|nr:MAG: hypothetical protein DMF63_05265 [Acidobacteriota bacterium]